MLPASITFVFIALRNCFIVTTGQQSQVESLAQMSIPDLTLTQT